MEPTWQSECGRVTLYRADCLDVLSTMEPGSVDAVVTDPPYSSGGMVRGDRTTSTRTKYVRSDVAHQIPDFTGDNRDQRGYLAWCAIWLNWSREVTTVAGASCAIFTDWRQLPITTDAVQAGGWVWRGVAPWVKSSARPVLGRHTNQCEFVVFGSNGARETQGKTAPGFFQCATEPNQSRQHITQKPARVMEWLLITAPSDGLIFDPFMGSGTTGIACLNTGRRFIGIEKDPHYFEVARKRIETALAQPSLFPAEAG